MTPERFARVRELFEQALDLPADSRARLLLESCAGDEEVRAEVERLLRQETRSSLLHGLQEELGEALRGRRRALPSTPPYRVVRPIGEGGMGVVYEAEQESPVRRKVALKLVRGGMDGKQVVARFESERQALALMNHPAIASVYDAGEAEDGRPFFAMELVPGVPVTEFCDQHGLSIRQRLELFIRICDGVQHAHQKGVIHRDLKPSNILVAHRDGEPAPKIIDFGIAKAATGSPFERALQTEAGQLIGTPEYMSPEQAELSNADIDTRSDVYSLGVLLYELLVGALPFASTGGDRSADDVRRRIRDEDPLPPSVAARRSTGGTADPARQLKGDLDWIVIKALEKDRTRRYQSASDLALDVRRHLVDQPVEARARSSTYTLVKFVRRHRIGIAAALVIGLSLLIGTLLATTGLIRARRAEQEAKAEAAKALAINRFLQETFGSAHPVLGQGRDTTVVEALATAVTKAEEAFAEQPEVHAALLNTVGRTYLGLGRYAEAEPVLRQALHLRRTTLGNTHRETAESLTSLGALLYAMGRFAEAEPLFREALEAHRDLFGEEHLSVSESLNDLAMTVQRSRRDYQAARLLLEESLAIRSRILGDHHPDIAQSLNNLAMLFYRTGDLDRAEPLFRRAIAMNESIFGPEHPELSTNWNNLARVLRDKGRLEEAEDLFDRVLEADRKLRGPNHPYVAATLRDLGDLRSKQGMAADAERIYREALAVQLVSFPADYWEVAKLEGRIGASLVALRKYDSAEPILLKSHATLRDSLGPAHPETEAVVKALIDLYLGREEPVKAEEYRRLLSAPGSGE